MSNSIRMMVLAGLAFGLATAASAGLSVGDAMYFGGMKSGQVAGPYSTHAVGASTFDSFWTFCVELDERLWNPGNASTKFHVVDALTTANSTGYSLTEEVAYLYTNFSDGLLAGYDHDSTRDRNALQYGIWSSLGYADSHIKSETRISTGKLDEMRGDWKASGWHEAFLASDWEGLGDVWVANISFGANKGGYRAGDPGQDVLTLNPNSRPPEVPAPGAVLLGMLGLSITGAIKRRQA